MARLVVLGSALVVVAGCVVVDDGAEEVDAKAINQAVIGGRPETDHPGAGYLVRDGVVSCSAALVEPDLVLTAAHCVERPRSIEFGWGEVSAGTRMRAIARAIHPRFRMPEKNGGVAFQGFDVALLRLERPVEIAPVEIGALAPSGSVRAIGYGATSYVAGDDGKGEAYGVGTERRSAEGLVVGHNATELFVRFVARSSACYGDSGGPLFASDGKVAGVLSRFTELTRCRPRDRSLMGYVRVDTMADFFREAKTCLSVADTARCLREDDRRLCDEPRFSDRGFPSRIEADEGDLRRGSTTIELADDQERALRITPRANVTLSLFSRGDAELEVLRVEPSRTTTEPRSEEVASSELESGETYDVVVRSCNGAKQSVTLSWQPVSEPTEAVARGRLWHAAAFSAVASEGSSCHERSVRAAVSVRALLLAHHPGAWRVRPPRARGLRRARTSTSLGSRASMRSRTCLQAKTAPVVDSRSRC